VDSNINYHAEILRVRGKTFLKPAGKEEIAKLKGMNFRVGGLFFAAACKALQKKVTFEVSANTMSKLDPFAFLIGDIGIPSQPRPAAKATSTKQRVIRTCVIEISCKCRGYNCKCTSKIVCRANS
jgi:hypothetical protein